MRRLISAAIRTIRAALHTGWSLVSAACRRQFLLIVNLYGAIDAGRAVRIGYRKADGSASERVIEPAELRTTDAGDITVRAFDQLRSEDRTFRIDRITNLTTA